MTAGDPVRTTTAHPAASRRTRAPSLLDALIPLGTLIGLIALTIALFGTDATSGPLQVALLTSAVVAGLVAFKNGYSASRIREAAIGGVSSGMSALFILLAVGALIGTWNMAGTIPTVVYYGLGLLSETWFYPATALVCGLVGLAIGSSWTTAATLGVAFVALAPLVGANPAIAAGAVISGAYFGDKMTPVSGDDGPRAVDGRRRDDQRAHRGDDLDVRAGGGDRARPVHDPRPGDARDGTGLRLGQRAGDPRRRVLDQPAQHAAARSCSSSSRSGASRRSWRSSAARCSPASWRRSRSRSSSRRSSTSPARDRVLTGIEAIYAAMANGFVSATGNETIDALFSRGGMAGDADDDLADPRRAELRRDHGGGRASSIG